MVEPSWVGRRVSIRRVVERASDDRPLFGDVVGDLVGLDAQTAVVESRTGLVEIPVALIAAAKRVPASTAAELALDAVAARGLRPAETRELGGWLLRADHGLTRRANSVLPLRQLGMPLDTAVDEARAWYAERGLPLLVAVQTEARRLLDAELGERGWRPASDSHVMVARIDQLAVPDDAGAVELSDAPDDAWLEVYRDGAGRDDDGRALLTRHDTVAFATIRRDGAPVAIGRGAVDDGWLGVMAVEVAPEHRRQGLAAQIMRALWLWGAAHGSTRTYLQVTVDNSAAVTFYDRLGYWVHHDYRYRVDPHSDRDADAPAPA